MGQEASQLKTKQMFFSVTKGHLPNKFAKLDIRDEIFLVLTLMCWNVF